MREFAPLTESSILNFREALAAENFPAGRAETETETANILGDYIIEDYYVVLDSFRRKLGFNQETQVYESGAIVGDIEAAEPSARRTLLTDLHSLFGTLDDVSCKSVDLEGEAQNFIFVTNLVGLIEVTYMASEMFDVDGLPIGKTRSLRFAIIEGVDEAKCLEYCITQQSSDAVYHLSSTQKDESGCSRVIDAQLNESTHSKLQALTKATLLFLQQEPAHKT